MRSPLTYVLTSCLWVDNLLNKLLRLEIFVAGSNLFACWKNVEGFWQRRSNLHWVVLSLNFKASNSTLPTKTINQNSTKHLLNPAQEDGAEKDLLRYLVASLNSSRERKVFPVEKMIWILCKYIFPLTLFCLHQIIEPGRRPGIYRCVRRAPWIYVCIHKTEHKIYAASRVFLQNFVVWERVRWNRNARQDIEEMSVLPFFISVDSTQSRNYRELLWSCFAKRFGFVTKFSSALRCTRRFVFHSTFSNLSRSPKCLQFVCLRCCCCLLLGWWGEWHWHWQCVYAATDNCRHFHVDLCSWRERFFFATIWWIQM